MTLNLAILGAGLGLFLAWAQQAYSDRCYHDSLRRWGEERARRIDELYELIRSPIERMEKAEEECAMVVTITKQERRQILAWMRALSGKTFPIENLCEEVVVVVEE